MFLFLLYLINFIVSTEVMGVLIKLSFPEKGDTDHSMKKVKKKKKKKGFSL